MYPDGTALHPKLTSLVRRAEGLRTYAGDTALPGGKVERGDRSLEDTAVRFIACVTFVELMRSRSDAKLSKRYVLQVIDKKRIAQEKDQIGLSLDKQKVPLLCVMEPFLARNALVVTP